MRSLSSGKNEEVILKLLRNLISSTQGNQFETYLDEEGIKDIADVLKSEKGIYPEFDQPKSSKQANTASFARAGDEEEHKM